MIIPSRGILPIMTGREITAISIFFTLAVLMPLTLGLVLRLLRRPSRATPPLLDPIMNARMDRLEQAMDAIAIEIERISEGQRFVTKVLTERPAQAPVPPGVRDAASIGDAKSYLAVRPSITPH